MARLQIITPCSRPKNLSIMLDNILAERVHDFFDPVTWYIVFDGENTVALISEIEDKHINDFTQAGARFYAISKDGRGLSGNPQRNFALDRLEPGGYVYFLDDDNIFYPGQVAALSGMANVFPDKALVTSQVFQNGVTRLIAHQVNMRLGGCDTAQFLVPQNMIGDLRWEPWDYCADAAFFGRLYQNNKIRFQFLRNLYCFYNALA